MPVTDAATVSAVADALLAARLGATTLAPVTSRLPGFDVEAAYAVLHELERRQRARGDVAVGRKIGFTNRTLWPRYGVYQPMWAHVWNTTVHDAADARCVLPLAGHVQPRIEPEVVFGLAGDIPLTDDVDAILARVAWVAAGFEIVVSPFPGWKFEAADCTAAFGLHGALVVGTRVPLDAASRRRLAARLPTFEVTLRRGDEVVDRGVGANVLDSPALALGYLAQVLDRQPAFARLAAGELVTTGTVTDAWPVTPGETWSSDYGELGIPGLALTLG